MSEALKETENLRVILRHDESTDKPYDEGAVPILVRYFHDYRGTFEAVNEAGKQYEESVSEAYNRMNRDMDLVARWLRIFYGAYSIMEDSSSEGAYLAFDTAAWRESVGITDEWLNRPDAEPEKLAEGSLNEVMAWTEGEVYGYVLERRLHVSKVYTDPTTGDEVRSSSGETVWETVDACSGFYGYDVAKEAAEEAFDNYAE